MSKSNTILKIVSQQQPIEASRIRKITNFDITEVHKGLRFLHSKGKITKRPKNPRRKTQPFVWEVVG